LDVIDRLARSANTQPKSKAELQANLAKRRAIVEQYSRLLTDARSGAHRAYRLPDTDGLRLDELWRTFVSMVRVRRDGVAYIVSLFENAIEGKGAPSDALARLQKINDQTNKLNGQFKKLATPLNKKLAGKAGS
jgi:hypothetical protein